MNILNGKRTVANASHETCAELYERLNAGYGMTLRNFQERFNARSETRFGMKRVATAKEVAAMEALYPVKIEKLKRVTATETPGAKAPPAVSKKINGKAKDWDMVAVRGLLGLGVVAHAVLIWHEMGYLWGDAGAIAGGIVFALIVPAVVLIRKKADTKPAKDILHVIWAVDIFAGLVHEKALYHQGTNAFGAGISEYGTGCLAAVISLIACALIYFYLETGLVVEKTKK